MTKLEEFEQNIKGKNVNVIGIGISNMPLIKLLVKLGAKVTAFDARDKEYIGDNYTACQQLGVKMILGPEYLDHLDGDIIFKTPGLRYDKPQILEAVKRGAVLTSEMETFFDICPAHIIGITGSDGKTTTTTLIHKMMTAAGYKTWLGGNIGNPVLDMAKDMTKDDWVILELSSFQLHTMKKTPERAVITNLSPNHLDWHTDYAEYIDAKTNIFKNMSRNNILVLNADNADSAALLPMAHCDVRFFSRKTKASIWLDGDTIRRGNEAVLNINDIKIPGLHNVENYMAAIGAVSGLVDDEVIVNTAKTFGGVPHRIELVREKDGVRYYNSSIDSSPNRTINALGVFNQKIIMLAGGKDKGIPYDEIGNPIADHVKELILISKLPFTEEDKKIHPTAGQIKKAVLDTGRSDIPNIHEVHTYEDAVSLAHSLAKSGDIVLLSPASTSFDMFRNFEERGNLFKTLVNEL